MYNLPDNLYQHIYILTPKYQYESAVNDTIKGSGGHRNKTEILIKHQLLNIKHRLGNKGNNYWHIHQSLSLDTYRPVKEAIPLS